jgi:hypothetical protein
MSDINSGILRLKDSNLEIAKFEFKGSNFSSEKAIIIAELYFNEVWRFGTVCQGFFGGLSALLNHFGGEEIKPDNIENQVDNPNTFNSTDTQIFTNTTTANTTLTFQSNKRICIRCKKEISILGSLSFDKGTQRCGKCISDIKQKLNKFRNLFIEYCSDDILTDEEWRNLKIFVSNSNLDMTEALSFVRGDALYFLERTLVFAFSDGIITDSEEAEFYKLKNMLNISDNLANSLIIKLKYLKWITSICKGNLPSIKSTSVLDSDEICHLETSAIYIKVNTKSVVEVIGRLIVTNKQIHFASLTGGWRIKINSILRVEELPGRINLELSVKLGNGMYKVEDTLHVFAVINTLVRICKRQMLIPQSSERPHRHIPQNVKNEVYQRDQGKCVQCGKNEYLEFDHVIPFSKGGANMVNNLQLLCRKCNLLKRNHL